LVVDGYKVLPYIPNNKRVDKLYIEPMDRGNTPSIDAQKGLKGITTSHPFLFKNERLIKL